MKQELKEKWLGALRSGKYRQSQNMLKKLRGGYCCLGVLCDIVKDEPEVQGEWRYNSKEDTYDFMVHGTLSAGKSLFKIQSETGIPVAMKGYIGLDGDIEDELVVLNDEEGYNFKEIADFIEKQVAITD